MTNVRRGAVVAVAAALALTACTTDRATTATSSASISATPTATPDAPLTTTNAFQVALAMVPPGDADWTGPNTGTLEHLDVCDGTDPIPGVTKGVYIGDQWMDHDDDGPLTRPLEELEGGAIAIPDGEQDAALRAVRSIASCPATDDDTTRAITSLPPAADGSASVRVDETTPQKTKKPERETFVVHAHRGVVVACLAHGTDADAVAEAALGCGSRATAAVDVIHDGMPGVGTISSAAVLAGRLRATAGTTVAPPGYGGNEPCYGGGRRLETTHSVSAQLVLESSGIAPAIVEVQPMPSAQTAANEVKAYRALAQSCSKGEHKLDSLSWRGGRIVVTRTAATLTHTAGGGIRFSSFFGTTSKRRGSFQHSEVFAVGPHVVVVTGEDADDSAKAATNVDAAIRDVLAN